MRTNRLVCAALMTLGLSSPLWLQEPEEPDVIFPTFETYVEFPLHDDPKSEKKRFVSFSLSREWWETDLARNQGWRIPYERGKGIYLLLAAVSEQSATPEGRLMFAVDKLPEGGMKEVYKSTYRNIQAFTGKTTKGEPFGWRRDVGVIKGYEWKFEHDKFAEGATTHLLTMTFENRLMTLMFEYDNDIASRGSKEYRQLYESLRFTPVHKEKGTWNFKRLFVRDHPECKLECFYASGRQIMLRRWKEPIPTWVFVGTRSGNDLATVTVEEITHEGAYGLEQREQKLDEAVRGVQSKLKAHPEFLSVASEDFEYGLLPAKLLTARYFGERAKHVSLRLVTVTPFMTIIWNYEGRESLLKHGRRVLWSTDYEFRPRPAGTPRD